jgi:hypothetical protein
LLISAALSPDALGRTECLIHTRRGKSSKSRQVAANAAPFRQWAHDLAAPKEDICPACRRLEDRLPAGILTLHGDFARQHANEILSLTRHEETAEKAEHPLNRIATIEHTDAGVVIATTDIHLPRRIGEALKRAYGGTLDMHFDDTAHFIRADWCAPF